MYDPCLALHSSRYTGIASMTCLCLESERLFDAEMSPICEQTAYAHCARGRDGDEAPAPLKSPLHAEH